MVKRKTLKSKRKVKRKSCERKRVAQHKLIKENEMLNLNLKTKQMHG